MIVRLACTGADGSELRMRNYYFLLPRSFAPATVLPQHLWSRADDARWLIATVLRKQAWRQTDDNGFAHLDSRVLRRVMAKDTEPQIVRALVDAGVIETSPHRAGQRSRGYRLTERFAPECSCRVPVRDPRLRERIERERRRRSTEGAKNWRPIHAELASSQDRHLTIDGAEADRILSDLPDHCRLLQSALVQAIAQREFQLSVSPNTGRVFNSVSSLKRELRPALRLDGQPIGCIDIRCAQPALLSLLIRLVSPSNGWKCPATYKIGVAGGGALPLPLVHSAALQLFTDCVTSGCLYDVLAGRSGLSPREAKKRLLVDLLAPKRPYPCPIRAAFEAKFPEILRFMVAFNRGCHSRLIRCLQQLEACVVIDTIVPKLVDRISVVTLHDAVYSSVENLGLVEQAFVAAGEEIGFQFTTKRE